MSSKAAKCPPVSEFKMICRICLSRSELRSIFNLEDRTSLSAKLKKCSGIRFRHGDGLPDKICKKCFQTLRTAFTFRVLSERSDKRLRAALEEAGARDECSNNESEIYCEVKHEVSTDSESDLKSIKDRIISNLEFKSEGNQNEKSEHLYEDMIHSTKVEIDDKVLKNDNLHSEEIELSNLGLKEDEMIEGNEQSKMHRCHWCPEDFSSRNMRSRHEKSKCHSRPPVSHPFECKKCFLKCKTRSGMEKHVMRHNTAAQPAPLEELCVCSICQKTLKSRSTLYTHMRLVHSQIQGVICPICEKKMKNDNSLRSHMRRHSDRVYTCALCPYRTNLYQSLELHRRKHSGERPFACEQCAHRFVNISNLNKHMLIHTGLKKHECTQCDKKFKEKKTLLAHVSSFHHGLRPFCCDKCGNKYAWYKTMRFHQKKAHP